MRKPEKVKKVKLHYEAESIFFYEGRSLFFRDVILKLNEQLGRELTPTEISNIEISIGNNKCPVFELTVFEGQNDNYEEEIKQWQKHLREKEIKKLRGDISKTEAFIADNKKHLIGFIGYKESAETRLQELLDEQEKEST